jgi:tetratricopeptide (TPR) repeat protein
LLCSKFVVDFYGLITLWQFNDQKIKNEKMKKLILLMILLIAGMQVFSQSGQGKYIPVTTNSKSALSFYNQGMKYFDEVKLKEALETFNKALNQDQDFFMVNYQLAFFYILNRQGDNFARYAEAAINCKAKLSDAEELLKEAMIRLHEGHNNITELGKKLVDMFPNDPNSYNNLVSFQSLAGDSAGMVETLNKAIKIALHPASFYNQLGYVYITLKQNDKAEEAFNRYIELEPKNPNVYDSKGDFYMYIKNYGKAYESYMIAFSMDPSYSRDKAEMAKQLYERTEGKKLKIITM